MKMAHLHEIKLVNGEVYQGEIVYKDEKGIRLRLANGDKIYFSHYGIILIKDLGWQRFKSSAG